MAKYPAATWRGPIPNQGGPIGSVRLGVMHIMEGTLSGTDNWFHNPAAQASSHFGIGKDGTVYQWVDTSETAWAQANYNSVAISIEHEGNSGDSLTPAQIAADAALYTWLHSTCQIPLQRQTDPSGTGWIGHGELGVPGGNHPNCPGSPILAQIPTIIAAANPQPTPPTPPIPEDAVSNDLIYDADGPGGAPSVFYVGSDNHVHQMWFNANSTPGQPQWHDNDLTATTNTPVTVRTP